MLGTKTEIKNFRNSMKYLIKGKNVCIYSRKKYTVKQFHPSSGNNFRGF